MYFVAEGDEAIELCAVLVDGCLQRIVELEFSTFDGTASSKLTSCTIISILLTALHCR